MKNVFLLLVCFLTLNILSAQIITDRPTQSAGSSTVPQGALQLESGFLISQNDGNETYLLKDNLQLDMAFGSGITQRMNFFTLGVSWLFGKE
jgi:hypothetical protein